MPIPSVIGDLSTTAASNSPAGSDPPTEGDNYLRALSAILKQTYVDISTAGTAAVGAGLVGYNTAATYATATVGYWLRLGGEFLQSGTDAITRTVQSKLRDDVSVKDFGAVGDGVTNDRAAIAAAVAAVLGNGKKLYFPAGQYLINTDGGSITLEEVTIVGEHVLDGANATIDKGVVLRITGTTNSPFKIRRGVTIDGIGFYYPSQTDTSTPTAYPVTLSGDFTNGAIQFIWIKNCVVFNAYQFADFNDASGNVGHVWIEDNTICVFNRGIYLRHNLEHFRIANNNFTFGHWLAATEANARAYMRANCTYIKVDQSDGIEVCDNLFFGSLNGYLGAASGLTQMQTISRNKFDNIRYAIKATGSGYFSGSINDNTFNSLNGQDTTLQGRSIEISTSGAGREVITIGPNTFQQATEDHVFVSGNTPTRDIIVVGANFLSWAAFKAAGAYGALNISGSSTGVSVTGCRFMGGNSAAYSNGIMGSVNTFDCSGNRFEGCLTPISMTTSYTTGSGNRSFTTGAANSDVITATELQWGPNAFDKPNANTSIQVVMGLFSNNNTYANDAAAAAAGIPIGGFYRNGSVLMVRVA